MDSINGTFYELMNISSNATTMEIKNKYKEMAKVIHPDKNPETAEEFKQLAAVYNILKDQKSRDNYHRCSACSELTSKSDNSRHCSVCNVQFECNKSQGAGRGSPNMENAGLL